MTFGLAFGFPRYRPSVGGVSPPDPGPPWIVLNSTGDPFICTNTVLDSDGNPFVVVSAVLDSDGNSFNPI